jgi:protein SCO1
MFMRACVVMALLGAAAGCSRTPAARQYELTGQVLAVRPADLEIVVRHEDIKGFMPGMTMPFKVKEERWLHVARPGDLITATLMVEGTDAWLSNVTPTGERAPLPPDLVLPRAIQAPLKPGEPVPEATLVDQQGAAFSPAQLRGSPWAVTFIYTRCPLPTFCPALDRRFEAVQQVIADDPGLSDARLVSVSFDPEFDTPEVLREHADKAGADPRFWLFVTGETAAVDRFGERFGLTVERGGGAPEDFVHTLRTAVVNREGRLVRTFEGTSWATDELIAALREASGS